MVLIAGGYDASGRWIVYAYDKGFECQIALSGAGGHNFAVRSFRQVPHPAMSHSLM